MLSEFVLNEICGGWRLSCGNTELKLMQLCSTVVFYSKIIPDTFMSRA